jgi:8-oxo-dGTP diphosphatase
MEISVAGIARQKDGLVFVAKRLPGGEMGGKWELPGGKAKAGEEPAVAVEREFFEELGLWVKVGRKLGETVFSNSGGERKLLGYEVCLGSLDDMVLVNHSVWKWAKPEELSRLDFTPSDLALLKEIENSERNS